MRKRFLDHALELKPAEKFYLIDLLVTSLDQPDEKINAIWLEEAKNRLLAHREKRTRPVSAKKVLNLDI